MQLYQTSPLFDILMAFRQYDVEARQGSVHDERALCNRTNLSSIWLSDNTTQKQAKVVSEQRDYDYGPLQVELRPAVNCLETQLVGSEAKAGVSVSSRDCPH